jgi:low affinity Fe/Cu permease
VRERFHRFALRVATTVGSPGAFLVALVSIAGWAILGPVFHFSDTWQLVVNTATTIVTFLIVFLIQNTQNRDARAIHLKLDELIFHLKGPRNWVLDIEHMSDAEMDKLRAEFERAAKKRRARDKLSHPES